MLLSLLLAFGSSSQGTQLLWPEVLTTITRECTHWACMQGIHKSLELALAKHGHYGPCVGTTLNPVARDIPQ